MKNRLPYEFRNFSQNLEDGIILELLSKLKNKNYLAIEIGSGNGEENMLRNLIENHNYKGFGHDILKNTWHHENYQHIIGKIELHDLDRLLKNWNNSYPDFFSLDIDSIDFWLLKDLLNKNFRPSIICVEYLSYYGPDLTCSVKQDLDYYHARSCGASLNAFKKLLSKYDYRFFTVDSKGINAFFYLSSRFEELDTLPFLEWISCKRYWNVPFPNLDDPRIEFNEKTLLG